MTTGHVGARWWKIDFHTHSPASIDYGKRLPDQAEVRAGTSPADWLLAFMRAEIDAVVVTDHNSGEWIDPLKIALGQLTESKPSGYRDLVLFPGVEITANGGGHVLAVLPTTAAAADVTALLGEVKYRGALGASDVAAEASPIDVVRAIVARGGIPILAHVDATNSSSVFDAGGTTLGPLLEVSDLFAMEVCASSWEPPQLYKDRRLRWSRVLGSDSHHLSGSTGPRFPGSHFTWVKMEVPTHEGLRLALLDGDDLSIRRSDLVVGDQNAHGHVVIESIEVSDARYCGRTSHVGQAPCRVALSPWLTTIIGGRGAGKSTLVEFSRIALRREEDLPKTLRDDFDAFKAVAPGRADRGALLDTTLVRLVVRKDGVRYRIQWGQSASLPPIEEERQETWAVASGDVTRRFPVRLFSQGQIFEMARDGRALLRIIDDSPEVDLPSWRAAWIAEESRYLAVRAKIREVQNQLAERPTIQAQLEDVLRKLAIFEQAEHAQTLRDYERSQRQRHAVETWTRALSKLAAEVKSAVDRLVLPDLDTSMFGLLNDADHALLDEIAGSRGEALDLTRRVGALADEAVEQHASWVERVTRSQWATQAESVDERYAALVAELRTRDVPDPDAYRSLVQQRRTLQERLAGFDELDRTLEQLSADADAALVEVARLRADLTSRRARFLAEVLRDNPHVRMIVEPYGTEPSASELRFREVLQRPDGLTDDILSMDATRGCLVELYRDLPADVEQRKNLLEQRLRDLKVGLGAVAAGKSSGVGGWFARHLQKLPPEALDRLVLWYPADDLAVSYSPHGDGRNFRSLEQGSRGQKAAAILAFLLAHGNEPIVLDQPEDDLDNELIYGLIVTQLRSNKRRRQVIVVTHDPNIVVNGDAELIVVMHNASGQCRLLQAGSLQSRIIRDEVCKVMEGGREALERRYRRMIVATDRHP